MALLRQSVLAVEVSLRDIRRDHALSAYSVPCSGRELDGLGFV
jgi:hypothetical protein